MKIYLLIISQFMWLFSCVSQPQNIEVSSGKLITISDLESDLVSDRLIHVWLPEGYSEQNKYPVLYMHDGQMLFDANTTWNGQEWGVDETIEKLVKSNEIAPCIVVGIANVNKDRHSDYFPQKPFEALPKDFRDSLLQVGRGDQVLFGRSINSDNYLKYLVTVVKPYIDKTFSTKPDRENTFIAGSSMGGLISMYAFFEYPKIFGGAACISTHWIGGFQQNDIIPNAFKDYIKERKELVVGRKLYFDHGTATLDQFYPPHQAKVDNLFSSSDYDKYVMTKKFEGAAHKEDDWKSRLHIPLTFLLSK